jgi:hypothetical protein
MRSQKYAFLDGQKFNNLTALHKAVKETNTSPISYVWLCDCGLAVTFPASHVVRGLRKDCGCSGPELKVCLHCGQSDVRWSRSGSSVCTVCRNAQTSGFKYRKPKTQMLANARQRAKKENVLLTITKNDFEIPELCPVLGVPLTPGTRANHDYSPTLDKVIPELGYVKGNVQVISHRANRIKSDSTLDELKKLVVYLEHAVAGTNQITGAS